jgi:hypothetical protein
MRLKWMLLLLAGCEVAVTTLTTNPPGTTTVIDTGPVDTGEPETDSWPVAQVIGQPHEAVETIIEVSWLQREPAGTSWIAYTFEGADGWLETPAQGAGVGEHTAVLLGIPEDRAVTFEIYSEIRGEVFASPEQYTARTGDLPGDLSEPTLRVELASAASEATYMLVSVDTGGSWFQGPFYVVILDRQGEIVWYRKTSDSRCSMFPRVARSGDHLIIDAATLYTFDSSLEPTVTRTTLDGRHAVERELPGLHYTYDEIDDGSFIYGSTSNSYEFYLDRLYPDGTIDRIWECYPWMANYAPDLYWACAPNTVLWRPETDTVLWSMFETSTVVELDLASGERVRQFGQLPDGWTFDPPEANFDLQHYPNITPGGTLIVSTHVEGVPYAQRAREFSFDDANQTLREIWSYGEETSRYATYAGEVQRMSSGNALMNFGTDGVIQELSPDNEVLWEVEWRDRLIGHTTPITDLYALNAWDGE